MTYIEKCDFFVYVIATYVFTANNDQILSPSPVAQSVTFALPKTDCWEDLDRIPLRGDNEIEMKGLGT